MVEAGTWSGQNLPALGLGLLVNATCRLTVSFAAVLGVVVAFVAPMPLITAMLMRSATRHLAKPGVCLTDVTNRRPEAFERFSGGAAGPAGTQSTTYHVWLEDWLAEEKRSGVTRAPRRAT